MAIVDVIRLLNAMVRDGVIEDYAVGGAVGATFYLEPVATVDVDVFVRLRPLAGQSLVDPSGIFAFLKSSGHVMEGEYVLVGGWPVQFLGPPGALGEEAMTEAVVADVEGEPVHVISAEHLAALALSTGRAKDKARLLQFIEEGRLDPQKFESIVERHGLAGQWDRFKIEYSDNP